MPINRVNTTLLCSTPAFNLLPPFPTGIGENRLGPHFLISFRCLFVTPVDVVLLLLDIYLDCFTQVKREIKDQIRETAVQNKLRRKKP